MTDTFLRSGKKKEDLVLRFVSHYIQKCYSKNNKYDLTEHQYKYIIKYIYIYRDLFKNNVNIFSLLQHLIKYGNKHNYNTYYIDMGYSYINIDQNNDKTYVSL